ncbi:unnamed protein product [Hermetia illucens]|uniref:Uncharacterized protein n=1 Tax=Hermetia illucens TaxID=343691 RepID=A0A7R8UCG0_HERIL|nr:unnamed protein product [Hermetia illucens]
MSWVQSAVNSPLPSGAVVGGQDSDGTVIYVGRAYHSGDLLPAKIIPQKQAAYVSYNGYEVFVQNYEVLCGDNYMWVSSGYGQVPEGSVPGGRSSDGECLYVPYDGQERNFQNYEVLVQKPEEDCCSCCCCC